ncbi:LysR family transcriptional regulator [Aestuariibacter sp. A3R04]|uniref:LysR family transcriptional regulator n=1 Tax=Aestuariibacter sp. A3R04 TaxID=2841571 RepID=UPI001C0A574C|nr:LysR family transcriptional regulator [Aestuariibacter sp. A3R04]MBU3022364.1 LysR family transcriptional regulator [Aestuariibacter sp. A3R04]
MNIAHLQLFVRIASTQNISAAGEELGLSPAVSSAHINKLESTLGVRLLHRTTRSVSLTEEGKAFLHHAEDVLDSVEAAKASVGAGSTSPAGTLRITAPASFGRMHLLPALQLFMQEFPRLTVDLKLSDTIIDLVEGGFDIAIRNSELKDSSLIARKLVNDRRVLCASPEYLQRNGEPKQPDDLKHHCCIVLSGMDTWHFKTENGERALKVNGTFKTDNGEAIRDACRMGIGITVNSTWSAYEELAQGKLVEVLPTFPLVSHTAIWAVYPSSRLLAPKVRAFIDFCSDYFSGVPYWEKALTENVNTQQ